MDQSMRKSNSQSPRLSGSLGELDPLMNYNTPLTIITSAGRKKKHCATDTLTIQNRKGCL